MTADQESPEIRERRALRLNESAPAGKELKYARVERERRFLLTGRPPGTSIRTTRIHDRYIHGTRIRLRRSVEVDAVDEKVFFKLTQKIPDPAGRSGVLPYCPSKSSDAHV